MSKDNNISEFAQNKMMKQRTGLQLKYLLNLCIVIILICSTS